MNWLRTHMRLVLGGGVVLAVTFLMLVPKVEFHSPHSTVILDRAGGLLGASLAADGQWRFPAPNTIPPKLERAIITFEDRRFWYHPGVDPIAVIRAFRENIWGRRVVSGGSTITMQLARMSRGNPRRHVVNKVLEALMALRLEATSSKREILLLYVGHAPYGGNVVGVGAASWRYFGRPETELSWAEAAMLAVLPNSPGLVHLARGRDELKTKRDGLLRDLRRVGALTAEELVLADAEPLPGKPEPIAHDAAHFALVRQAA